MAEGAGGGTAPGVRGAAALRVRQRFSGFYDLKVRQDGNEHDVNSTHFNSESYVQSVRGPLPSPTGRCDVCARVPPGVRNGAVGAERAHALCVLAGGQVLKAKSLPELVQHSNELSVEIKELDSDMQMLVYENYNKFISTTDTIQDMKTKVDGMEGEMGRLAAAVSEITESSSRINENLADRRVRIQKLNGVRRLLKKLSFIFELPTRLKRTVELDAGAEAVRRPRLSQLCARTHNDLPALSTSCFSSTLS